MANVQAPFGIRPVRRLDGAVPNYNLNQRYIAYNNTQQIGRFDPVRMLTTGFIALATASTTMNGIFMGCSYYDPTAQRTVWYPNWPAPTLTNTSQFDQVKAWVIDDPYLVFEGQAGGSTTTGFVEADVGANCNFVNGGTPNAFGNSVAYLDQSTIATTASFCFRVIRLSQKVGNDNASPYNTVEVVMNNQDYKTTTGI